MPLGRLALASTGAESSRRAQPAVGRGETVLPGAGEPAPAVGRPPRRRLGPRRDLAISAPPGCQQSHH
jgi:hypothetical protein